MSETSESLITFRKMSRHDLAQVLEIERRSFRLPWEEERFRAALAAQSGYQSVVMETKAGGDGKEGRVIGYFVLEVHATSTHIVNLAIHPEYRRRGLASSCLLLIDKLAMKAAEIARSREKTSLEPLYAPPGKARVSRSPASSETVSSETKAKVESKRGTEEDARESEIHLEVEESNLAAQLLYRKMGYRATQILRNFYSVLHEDGYKMVRKIPLGQVDESTARLG